MALYNLNPWPKYYLRLERQKQLDIDDRGSILGRFVVEPRNSEGKLRVSNIPAPDIRPIKLDSFEAYLLVAGFGALVR